MMSGYIWKLSLTAAFGRNTRKPFRIALLKLGLAFVSAGALGFLLAGSLKTAPLPLEMSHALIFFMSFFLAVCFTSFALLLLFSSLCNKERVSRLLRMISVLPVSRSEMWILARSPLVIVCGVLVVLSVPLLWTVAPIIGAPVWLLILGFALGTGGSLGFILVPTVGLIYKVIMMTLYTALGIRFIEKLSYLSGFQAGLFGGGLIAVGLLGYGGYWLSYRMPYKPIQKSSKAYNHPLLARYSYYDWFVLKLLRNHRTRSSIVFCSTLCTLLAVFILLKHMSSAVGPGILIFGALCAAALGSDIRGISRRYKTPEAGVKSILFFVMHQCGAGYAVAVLIGAPLFIVITNTAPVLESALYFVGLQFGGFSLGLLASTIFVPEDGDFGSQFFAATMAIAGLLYLPRLLCFSEESLLIQSYGWMGVGCMGILVVYVIETIRRKRYGNAGTI